MGCLILRQTGENGHIRLIRSVYVRFADCSTVCMNPKSFYHLHGEMGLSGMSKERYIILEDDPNLFDQKNATPYLYLVSPKTGLTDTDVKKILKKVNICF